MATMDGWMDGLMDGWVVAVAQIHKFLWQILHLLVKVTAVGYWCGRVQNGHYMETMWILRLLGIALEISCTWLANALPGPRS
jgi:hypothetical protein